MSIVGAEPFSERLLAFGKRGQSEFHDALNYSHSIVPGGLLVTSYTTRLIPFTSLMILVATRLRNACSNG